MARQVSLNRYSLSNIGQLRKSAEEETLDSGVTISVTYSSTGSFEHNFTIDEEVKTQERYDEIEDKTIEKAKERLRKGFMQANSGRNVSESEWQDVWNEIQSSREIRRPERVREFLEKKEALPYLTVAENITEDVYGRVGRGRSISIQQRLNQSTDELGDLNSSQKEYPDEIGLSDIDLDSGNSKYYSNMKKVDTNLDFEDNIEGGDVLLEGRQRTTGDLTWYNREGESRYYLITSVGVIMQDEQGGTRLRSFNDKSEAWSYYQENRLG